MTLDAATPVTTPHPARLGRIARGLGIASFVCGVLAGLLWALLDGTWYGALPALGVPLGLGAIVVGIIALIMKRGRKDALIGMLFALLAGPATLILQIAVFVIGGAFI